MRAAGCCEILAPILHRAARGLAGSDFFNRCSWPLPASSPGETLRRRPKEDAPGLTGAARALTHSHSIVSR